MNSPEYDLLRALGLTGDPHEDEDLRIIREHLRRVAEEAQGPRKQCRCGQDTFNPYRHDACYNCRQHDADDLAAAREQVRRLREAADWVLHVAHGVGKAGEEPEPGEYEASMAALEAEAFPERPAARAALAETEEKHD